MERGEKGEKRREKNEEWESSICNARFQSCASQHTQQRNVELQFHSFAHSLITNLLVH